MSEAGRERIETTLGPPLVRIGPVWALDLGELPILHGLSVLSRALGERVLEQARSDRLDITVEREIRERENPELLVEFGLGSIQLRAQQQTVRAILLDPDGFQDRLRTVFGTLQRPRYRGALCAPGSTTAGPTEDGAALVFDFDADSPGVGVRYVLERVESEGGDARAHLRIAVEGPATARPDSAPLPHVRVEDLERRAFIAGSTRIAETLAQGARREAERGRRSFTETRRRHDHTFQQLGKAGLSDIEQIVVHWEAEVVPELLDGDPIGQGHLMKRVLLALEDDQVRDRLAHGDTVRIDAMRTHVYLDRSQLGRVLNLSLGSHRRPAVMDDFLERMPATLGVVRSNESGAPLPFEGTSIFLVHHMTAEVLGLIAGLRRLGCRDLVTLFVAYAGDAPSGYLGPLLELPPAEFTGLALVNVPEEDSVEGRWALSHLYSKLEGGAALEAALAARDARFYGAMQTAALATFVPLMERAAAAGRRVLLVEDGGYLAPLLNRAALEGRTLADVMGELGLHTPTDDATTRPVSSWLDAHLVGSVEHTRNGFDRLAEIEAEHGRLAVTAASIAISKLKTEVESKEVSASILNAAENVLSSLGLVLSRRHCLVLGSRGSIGRHLMHALRARLDDPTTQLCGVDRVCQANAAVTHEFEALDLVPAPERLDVDLIIGVTGRSIIEGGFIEAWLGAGTRQQLVLVSGSTKTEEFADIALWIEALWTTSPPRIAGRAAAIEVSEIQDPVSGRLFGHRYRFEFEDESGAVPRDLFLVANLTPANFLFYGVPTEAIDDVLAQLLCVSLGLLVREPRTREPARLLAVDRDIDDRARDLG